MRGQRIERAIKQSLQIRWEVFKLLAVADQLVATQHAGDEQPELVHVAGRGPRFVPAGERANRPGRCLRAPERRSSVDLEAVAVEQVAPRARRPESEQQVAGRQI